MTTAALAWGSAFVAFGPFASLLFGIAWHKAQLIIVVTTSAFAYLLAAFLSSLIYLMLNAIGIGNSVVSILLPGVVFSFISKCYFVKLYHKVEKVISVSIARHEERQEEFHESAKLRLELNDWACGIAAGTGFGGMHAVMLYGTLLASEAGNVGTLYQQSCPAIPSLALSAVNAFLFSLLDIVWMLLTFYGMGKRKELQVETSPLRCWGAFLGNSKRGGDKALAICFVTHLMAAFVTAPNASYQGCHISVPLLVFTVCITALLFWAGVSKIYLPENQRLRLGMNANSAHGD
jgi:hypothetical protein